MSLAEEFSIRKFDPLLADAKSRRLQEPENVEADLTDIQKVFREISRLETATTKIVASSAGVSTHAASERLSQLRRQGVVRVVSRHRHSNTWQIVPGKTPSPSSAEISEQRTAMVLGFIQNSHEPLSRRDIASGVGITKDQADKIVKRLMGNKKIMESDVISRAGKSVVRYCAVDGLEALQ